MFPNTAHAKYTRCHGGTILVDSLREWGGASRRCFATARTAKSMTACLYSSACISRWFTWVDFSHRRLRTATCVVALVVVTHALGDATHNRVARSHTAPHRNPPQRTSEIAPSHTASHCTAPHTALHRTTRHYYGTTRHYTALHGTTRHRTPHYTALHQTRGTGTYLVTCLPAVSHLLATVSISLYET